MLPFSEEHDVKVDITSKGRITWYESVEETRAPSTPTFRSTRPTAAAA